MHLIFLSNLKFAGTIPQVAPEAWSFCGGPSPPETHTSMAARAPVGVFHLLRRGELTGKWPTSLRALPPRFCERIDTEDVRASLARPGMGSLLLQLEEKLALKNHRVQSELRKLEELVHDIGGRVIQTPQQRHIFLMCHGDVLLLQLLLQLVPTDTSAIEPLAPFINETIHILVSSCLSAQHALHATSPPSHFWSRKPLSSALSRPPLSTHTRAAKAVRPVLPPPTQHMLLPITGRARDQ